MKNMSNETMNRIKTECDERFENHIAKLVQDTDRFTIIDWGDKNGSSVNYINYIIDKNRGSLIVSGDLGDSVATWFRPHTATDIKNFIKNNAGYYASKFQTSSHKYYYDVDNIWNEIKTNIDDDDEETVLEILKSYAIQCHYDSVDELVEDVKNYIEESIIHTQFFRPTSDLLEIVEDLCGDTEWLYELEGTIHDMVYIWAKGFERACEQLGL